MANQRTDTIDKGGGGSLDSIRGPMQNALNAIRSSAAGSGASPYMAAAHAAGSNASGGVAVGPTYGQSGSGSGLDGVRDVVQNGVDKITGTDTDDKPKTRTVTYIGNSGTKAKGTTKVTPGTTPDYYNQMGSFYQNAYDEQVAANEAAQEAARQRAQELYDAQVAALGEQYAGTNRQLYRDYMNSRRTLPQQMAAQGYSGGLSESSLLRLANAYGEGLNENERARLSQVAGYDQALSQQLYEAQMRTTEANNQARQNLYTQQAALREAIYRDAQQRAATMAAAGDFSEYAKLGFSKSEINWLKSVWKKMNPGLA